MRPYLLTCRVLFSRGPVTAVVVAPCPDTARRTAALTWGWPADRVTVAPVEDAD